jgi:pimeloyl-ACP methyl ester carboxylesterase
MAISFTDRLLELMLALLMGVSSIMGVATQAAFSSTSQSTTGQTASRSTIDCAELSLFDTPLVTPDMGQVECGTLQVPENWAQPDGRKISITYVVLKSTSPTPKADPILYLEGGPGGSALSGLDAYANEIFDEMRQDRDIVLFDQRGTQFSSPLVCSFFTVEELFDDSLFGSGGTDTSSVDLSPAFDETQLMEDARLSVGADTRRCVNELTSSGIDLRQYNSVASAHDAVTLMESLGYPSYNLFGISYGTRLALVMMREHPDAGIRSVVLDSSFPPEIPGFERFVTEAHEVVLQLFADCKVDPVCDGAYPNLKERFKTLLRSAEVTPIEGNDGTTVSALDLVSVVTGISAYTESAAYIPLMIAELEQGNTATYNAIVSGSIVGLNEIAAALEGEAAADEAPLAEAAPALPGVVDLEANAQAEAFIASIKARASQLSPDDSDTVLTLLTWLDKVPRTRESLQTFIEESFAGDTQTATREALLAELAALSDAAVARVFSIMANSVDVIDIYTIGLNQPTFNSVECNEEAPFEDFSNVIANAQALEIPELAYGAISFMAEQFATCEFWPSGRADDIESEPVVSDIPTLIMAGNYDFQTPVSWNRSAFVNLSSSFYAQFPSSGHGVIAQSQCAKDVAREFIDTPFKQPNTGCTADLWPIWAMPSS